MKRILEFLKPMAGLILVGILAYFFPEVFTYFIIAVIISLIGRPLNTIYCKIHFKKMYLPAWLGALMTLLSMLIVIAGFVLIIGPQIGKQAQLVYNINIDSVMSYFREPITKIHQFLINIGFVMPEQDFTQILTSRLKSIVNITQISHLFGDVVSRASSFFIGAFSVCFLSFFLIKDRETTGKIIMSITPEPYLKNMNNVLTSSRTLMSRYFIGLLTEMVCMATLLSLVLWILGINNALLIGCLGGFLNMIPYLGPFIGGTIGTILAVISSLSLQQYDMLLPHALMVIATFASCNFVDNIVFQPLIYSKSVDAHPIEIFLVIIMAGKLWGVVGMVAAIPAYTILRILGKEFFNNFKFVSELTKNLGTNNNETKGNNQEHS